MREQGSLYIHEKREAGIDLPRRYITLDLPRRYITPLLPPCPRLADRI